MLAELGICCVGSHLAPPPPLRQGEIDLTDAQRPGTTNCWLPIGFSLTAVAILPHYHTLPLRLGLCRAGRRLLVAGANPNSEINEGAQHHFRGRCRGGTRLRPRG